MTVSANVVVAGAITAVLLAGGAALYLKGVAHEKVHTVAAQDATDVSHLETLGAKATAARVDLYINQRDQGLAATARAMEAASAAKDANEPLDPARTDRLGAADRELCARSPRLCGAPD